jgi:hypothetical protein
MTVANLLQYASAGSGAVAAILWWRSATFRAPALLHDGGASMQKFVARVGRWNMLAAILTGLSVFLTALATAFSKT